MPRSASLAGSCGLNRAISMVMSRFTKKVENRSVCANASVTNTRDTLAHLTIPPMNQPVTELTSTDVSEDEAALLAKEARYCSYGDTVHYAEKPKLFERCNGSYLYDLHGGEYLDLQMWYSAVNLGYANPEVSKAMRRQLETLPQLACQYLHREKI